MCLGPARLCWPLTPALMYSTFPPLSRNALVCSSIERDVSVDGFFFAEDLAAMRGLYILRSGRALYTPLKSFTSNGFCSQFR